MNTAMRIMCMSLLTLPAAPALSSCSEGSSASGAGTVVFTTYGEEYIEGEIPASDVEDGWTVRYTKFLVVLGEVAVAASSEAEPALAMPGSRLFDLHRPGGKRVFEAELPARAYPFLTYVIVPATTETMPNEDVPEADRAFMAANGYSLFAEGSLSKDGTTKTFAWGFATSTLYLACRGMLSGKETDGVVVRRGGTDEAELTIHGDHLFYDDLQSPDAKLRGAVIAAADADDDGEVTLEELAAVELATLSPDQGPFGTSTASGVHDLRAFVEALSRTVGHFRGEGECLTRPR
jgi:hypothetical protein